MKKMIINVLLILFTFMGTFHHVEGNKVIFTDCNGEGYAIYWNSDSENIPENAVFYGYQENGVEHITDVFLIY